MTNELLDYIESWLSEGRSAKEIREALSEGGYSDSDIERFLDEAMRLHVKRRLKLATELPSEHLSHAAVPKPSSVHAQPQLVKRAQEPAPAHRRRKVEVEEEGFSKPVLIMAVFALLLVCAGGYLVYAYFTQPSVSQEFYYLPSDVDNAMIFDVKGLLSDPANAAIFQQATGGDLNNELAKISGAYGISIPNADKVVVFGKPGSSAVLLQGKFDRGAVIGGWRARQLKEVSFQNELIFSFNSSGKNVAYSVIGSSHIIVGDENLVKGVLSTRASAQNSLADVPEFRGLALAVDNKGLVSILQLSGYRGNSSLGPISFSGTAGAVSFDKKGDWVYLKAASISTSENSAAEVESQWNNFIKTMRSQANTDSPAKEFWYAAVVSRDGNFVRLSVSGPVSQLYEVLSTFSQQANAQVTSSLRSCGSLFDEAGRESCFMSAFGKVRDPQLCEVVTDGVYKARCIGAVARFPSDAKVCEQVSSDYQSYCYASAVDWIISSDSQRKLTFSQDQLLSLCQKISLQELKLECVYSVAAYAQSAFVCDSLANSSEKQECVNRARSG